MEVVKSMIHDQDIPMHLWAEAKKTVVYVQNILSHNLLGNKTLENMFTGENHEASHLKIFGCHVYLHVPKDKYQSWTPQERREYLLDTMTSQKLAGSIFQVSVRLRLAEMSHLMKMQLSANPERPMHMKFMKKRKKLPE